jgi:hypothetical protein
MIENPGGFHFRSRRRWLTAAPVVLSLLLAGCGEEEIVVDYGHRAGTTGAESLNGTAVFGRMFESAGHQVESKRVLAPSLDEVQTIVWFPDSYRVPAEDARDWLDRWLWSEPGRTLIYVGRGYDAEPRYWQQVASQLPADVKPQATLRRTRAESRVRAERGHLPDHDECDWFELINNDPVTEISSLEGPWAADVDVAKADLELTQQMIPTEWFEVLLESKDQALVSREVRRVGNTWRQRVFVANGSFLLNFGLVNHENRKLAGRLIESVGPPGRVVFLESGENGPRMLDGDSKPELPQTLALFAVWPINAVLLHFVVLGIIFGFASWPIFGNPKAEESAGASNFSDHAVALGKLLQRTQQHGYAARRVAEYRNLKP